VSVVVLEHSTEHGPSTWSAATAEPVQERGCGGT
jgi:hypothetical protein